MTVPADDAAPPADAGGQVVVIPSGAPLLDVAAWVGASVAAELAVHQRLTDRLAVDDDPDLTGRLWAIRAHRAETAEAWHRRLPELREMPREGFVVADDAVAAELDGIQDSEGGGQAVIAALMILRDRYHAHQRVAVGPADGPVADTLARAVATIDDDLALLSTPPSS